MPRRKQKQKKKIQCPHCFEPFDNLLNHFNRATECMEKEGNTPLPSGIPLCITINHPPPENAPNDQPTRRQEEVAEEEGTGEEQEDEYQPPPDDDDDDNNNEGVSPRTDNGLPPPDRHPPPLIPPTQDPATQTNHPPQNEAYSSLVQSDPEDEIYSSEDDYTNCQSNAFMSNCNPPHFQESDDSLYSHDYSVANDSCNDEINQEMHVDTAHHDPQCLTTDAITEPTPGQIENTSDPNDYYPFDKPPKKWDDIVAPSISMVDHRVDNRLDAHNLALLCIFDLCEAGRVPFYFFDAILQIFKEEQKNIDFTKPLTRKTFVKMILKEFKSTKPEVATVSLESCVPRDVHYHRKPRNTVRVPFFDFKAQAESIFNDHNVFSDLQNIVVNHNPNDVEARFKNYINPQPRERDEILDSRWYHDTVQWCHAKYGPEVFVCPVELYADKTGTDAMCRYGIEPVVMTFPILRRRLRNQPHNWRILCFIPDMFVKSKAEKEHGSSTMPGQSARNWHKCIRIGIQSYIDLQQQGPVMFWVRLGDRIKYLPCVFPLWGFLGDAKCLDMVCCRFAAYKNCSLSRRCDIQQQQADNPTYECGWRNEKEIRILVKQAMGKVLTQNDEDNIDARDTEANVGPFGLDERWTVTLSTKKKAIKELHAKSIHPVDNAFFRVWKGVTQHGSGIFGITYTDLMHLFESGWLKTTVQEFVKPWSTTTRVAFDGLIDQMFGSIRSSERLKYFRTTFANGITNLTNVTASEWSGFCLAIYLVGRSSIGASFLAECFQKDAVKHKKARDAKAKRQAKAATIQQRDNQKRAAAPGKKKDNRNKRKRHPGTHYTEPDETDDVNDPIDDINDDDIDVGDEYQPCTIDRFCVLMETLLCFHAFYHYKDTFYMMETEDDCMGSSDDIWASISAAMKLLIRTFPKPPKKGNGFRRQKIHEALHIPLDIDNGGHPMNYHTGVMERGLQYWAKIQADSVRKGQSVFIDQIAQRTYVSQCAAKAKSSIPSFKYYKPPSSVEQTNTALCIGEEDDDNKPDGFVGKPKFELYFCRTTPAPRTARAQRKHLQHSKVGKKDKIVGVNNIDTFRLLNDDQDSDPLVTIKWFHSKQTLGYVTTPPMVIEYFHQWQVRLRLKEKVPGFSVVRGFTEYRRDGVLYRAHPNYRSGGAWYDWAMVEFENYPDLYPCKLLCFFWDPVTKRGNKTPEPSAIVHCAQEVDPLEKEQVDSHGKVIRSAQSDIICTRWLMEYDQVTIKDCSPDETEPEREVQGWTPALRRIPLSAIRQRLFVVECYPGIHEFVEGSIANPYKEILVLTDPKKRWAHEFTRSNKGNGSSCDDSLNNRSNDDMEERSSCDDEVSDDNSDDVDDDNNSDE